MENNILLNNNKLNNILKEIVDIFNLNNVSIISLYNLTKHLNKIDNISIYEVEKIIDKFNKVKIINYIKKVKCPFCHDINYIIIDNKKNILICTKCKTLINKTI